MDIKSEGDDWQLIERDGISYYVHAKFIKDSWTGYIECRSCLKGGFSDESFPHDTADQAIVGAKIKSNFHHSTVHKPAKDKKA